MFCARLEEISDGPIDSVESLLNGVQLVVITKAEDDMVSRAGYRNKAPRVRRSVGPLPGGGTDPRHVRRAGHGGVARPIALSADVQLETFSGPPVEGLKSRKPCSDLFRPWGTGGSRWSPVATGAYRRRPESRNDLRLRVEPAGRSLSALEGTRTPNLLSAARSDKSERW